MRRICVAIIGIIISGVAAAGVVRRNAGDSVYAAIERDSPMVPMLQQSPAQMVKTILFTSDSRYLLTNSEYVTPDVRIWNREGQLVRNLPESGRVQAVAPDGSFFVCADPNDEYEYSAFQVRRLDGRLLYTSSEKGFCIGISPDSQKIYYRNNPTSRSRPDVKVMNRTGAVEKTITVPDAEIIGFSPQKELLVLKQYDRTNNIYSLFNVATSQQVQLGAYPERYSIGDCRFSSDGSRILIKSGSPMGNDPSRKLVSTTQAYSIEGKLLCSLPAADSDADIAHAVFSPDSTSFYAAVGKELRKYDLNGSFRTILTAGDVISSIGVSPDGAVLAVSSGVATLELWSAEGIKLTTFGGDRKSGGVYLSPDGKRIATFGNGINLYSLDGKLLSTYATATFRHMAFSPDGKHIATCGGFKYQDDRRVEIWYSDGRRRAEIVYPESYRDIPWVTPMQVAFTPDGKSLLVGYNYRLMEIFDLDGNRVQSIGDAGVTEISFMAQSPDGQRIIIPAQNKTELKLYSLPGGDPRELAGHTSFVNAVAWNPNGRFFATTSDDKTVKVWSAGGRVLKTIAKGVEPNAVAWTPDGAQLAVGYHDGAIRFYSGTGALQKTLTGHAGLVNNLTFAGRNTLVSSGWDDTIRVWNVKSGEHAIMMGFGTTDWIIFTPDGYWDGSPHGGRYVTMVKGLTTFGIDQFAVRNNRPDIIVERLGTGTPELIAHFKAQYHKRLKKLGLKETDLSNDAHVPQVKIMRSQQKDDALKLECTLWDDAYRLTRYNVFVNDVPLYGAYGVPATGTSMPLALTVPLTPGRNKVEVSCTNEKGVESYRAQVNVEFREKKKGDLYYIGFGVSRYRDGSLNLKYADKDAADLEKLFMSMKGKYGAIITKTYLNEAVTVENIRAAKQLLRDAKPEDTFVLFIAGHGVHDADKDATYYYLTHGAERNNLAGTCADFDLIEDLLQGVAPRNKLFLMDTCESGEVEEELQTAYRAAGNARGMSARTARAIEVKPKGAPKRGYLYQKDRYIYNDLIRRSGAIVFSSSRGGEYSWEHDSIQNGYFTREIINGIEKRAADADRDGVVSVDELRAYVSSAVAKATGDQQHPTVDRDNLYQKFGFPGK